MWPFKKSWKYYITLPAIDPEEAAATYLNDLGQKLQVPRKGWRFLFLDFRESDQDYRARLEPALKASWRKSCEVKIEEGVKTIVAMPPQNGMLESLKSRVMDEVNPKYIEHRMGGEIENPNYDPNMTFEEAQRLGRERYLRRKG